VFVALVLQYAKHMRCILLSSVTFRSIVFFHLTNKENDFRKKSYAT